MLFLLYGQLCLDPPQKDLVSLLHVSAKLCLRSLGRM